jgi:hypothetical protein
VHLLESSFPSRAASAFLRRVAALVRRQAACRVVASQLLRLCSSVTRAGVRECGITVQQLPVLSAQSRWLAWSSLLWLQAEVASISLALLLPLSLPSQQRAQLHFVHAWAASDQQTRCAALSLTLV